MISRDVFLRTTLPSADIRGTAPESFSFSIDSRSVNKGDIFVAIQGQTQDGHAFIKEAFQKGAAGVILEAQKKHILDTVDAALLRTAFIVLVQDTTQALVELAGAWRKQFTYPVVGITGSVGKTSTKESLAHLCSVAQIPYIASQGNQNTIYGLALNLLRMREHHKVAFFEMGISKPGEMARLAAMAKPTIGIITHIGHAHMHGLGSVHNIAIEKRDIFKYFNACDIGIINGDQPLLSQVAYNHPVIKFGTKTTNQVQARKVHMLQDGVHFTLKWYGKKASVTLTKMHAGAVFNCLATVSVGHLLHIPDETLLKAIQQDVVVPGRFQRCPLKSRQGYLINDAYNANPESVKAALLAFEKVPTDAHKVVVMGDMLDLGQLSPFWHRQIGRFFRKAPSVKSVILVGSLVKWVKKTLPLRLKVIEVPSWQEAVPVLQEELKDESLVLVKGSLGMHLQKMIDQFIE